MIVYIYPGWLPNQDACPDQHFSKQMLVAVYMSPLGQITGGFITVNPKKRVTPLLESS